MKKLSIALLIIGLLTVVLIVTCPKSEDHKSVLTQNLTSALKAAYNNEMDESDPSFGDIFVGLFGDKIVGSFVDNMVTVDNYFVVSLGRIEDGDKNKVISVGLLGHVFAPTKDDIINNIRGNKQTNADEE